MNIQYKRYQAGFSLTEALVAFAVVTGGLLAVASFQAGLFSNSAYNKARTEALSLAQEKIEEFRHYSFADEDNYIDDNADGVMDADGDYQEAPIPGNNADFVRSWDLTTNADGKRINVTVSWVDASNETQSVALASTLTFLSPRSGADQLVELSDPLITSPTGRAELGEGTLDDYPTADLSPMGSPGVDGLSTYRYQDDLFLVDPNRKVVLRLRDACSSTTGVCTDFVKISGTVYLDVANVSNSLQATDILVIASDAAHCQRWSDSGSLATPSTTANGDYAYFNYTCYFGGGWFGNIGFVTTAGLKQSDKVCQGDPTSVDTWAQPVIALRRAYRGMLSYTTADGQVQYFSHGIKDATQLTGHDFVFTSLSAEKTLGSACMGSDAPMTRADSAGGKLFAGMPVDFVCLNADVDGDLLPDYLDAYDTTRFTADASCPYNPTDPPVLSYVISGSISILAAGTPDLSAFNVVTSDGANNCKFVSPFTATSTGYTATYACLVWDWGDGWTGGIQVRPNSTDVYCPTDTALFSQIYADQTQSFSCKSSNTITIGGSILYLSALSPVSALTITDALTGFQGVCEFSGSAYRCVLPYELLSTDLKLEVTTLDHVCGATAGVYAFFGYSKDGSPYAHDIVVTGDSALCPNPTAVLEPAL
jgi:type II secretory pathway pseudopilin PulG